MKNLSTAAASKSAAYKSQAISALRADAPITARLARYNAAMNKARALEAVGGAA